jgi:hypothetical protein
MDQRAGEQGGGINASGDSAATLTGPVAGAAPSALGGRGGLRASPSTAIIPMVVPSAAREASSAAAIALLNLPSAARAGPWVVGNFPGCVYAADLARARP